MTYSVEFTRQAEEDLARLDKTIAQHIADKIDWLSQSMESIIPAPLKGKLNGLLALRLCLPAGRLTPEEIAIVEGKEMKIYWSIPACRQTVASLSIIVLRRQGGCDSTAIAERNG